LIINNEFIGWKIIKYEVLLLNKSILEVKSFMKEHYDFGRDLTPTWFLFSKFVKLSDYFIDNYSFNLKTGEINYTSFRDNSEQQG
jgi:hypothetical protein